MYIACTVDCFIVVFVSCIAFQIEPLFHQQDSVQGVHTRGNRRDCSDRDQDQLEGGNGESLSPVNTC